MIELLSIDGFCRFLGDRLLGPSEGAQIEPDAALVADTEEDAVHEIEVVCALAELDVSIRYDELARLATVRDLYKEYVVRRATPRLI